MSTALEMSDEEFLKSSPEETESELEETEVTSESPEEDTEEEVESLEEEDLDEENPSEEAVEEPGEDEELDSSEDNSDTTLEKEEEDVQDTSSEEAQRVFEPFKANGKEIQVKSADEAIQLMQMGANYTKKMQALQPNLKVLKMLEQQDLLSEEKLSFLIDLNKKDPKAIAKLVKDSEIDPMNLEPEEGEGYVPQNYSVPDEAIQLEQVLLDIENTPTYAKCIDVVGNQWDSSSKQVLSQNPALIKQLNEQMQQGIFDQINQEVDRLKMFGGLSGLSDFDAYKQVGSQLYQAGQLGSTKPKPVAKTQVEVKTQDTARTLKRRAASSPKSSKKTVVTEKEFNPLSMSDDEFSKIVNR